MKFIKKSDFIVISAIVAVSIVLWLIFHFVFEGQPARAEIYYGSELVETVNLDTGIEKTFSIPQNEHVVFHLYKDGSIRFETSDCPDKVCIRAGKLVHAGDSAACLPNRIVLKIVSKNGYSKNDLVVE
ncbi:NusG domain II-containing protein [Oscillospiraceae bacterium PP1C4]